MRRAPPTETADVAPPGARPRVRRLVRVFPEPALTIELTADRQVIGREPPNGATIDDPRASREHAAIEHVPALGVDRLIDLESKNGTFLDGRRIESEPLAPGSIVRLGDTLFVYAAVELPPNLDRAPEIQQGSSLSRAFAEQIAKLAAPSELSILILGPTGAGKEVLARRIHAESGRIGAFVAVSCATLSQELLGSELFGHVKGAFSGATADRTGLIAGSGGGTLFLDEVAELPPAQQAALLRVLQEREVRPVGADQALPVDLRVVSATGQNVDQHLREDLVARLAAVTIVLPGLAERREEILPLFRSFAGPKAPPLTADAAESLLIYDWPRNVRELEQVAAKVRLFSPLVDRVDRAQLPPELTRPKETNPPAEPKRPAREALIALLEKHQGNIARVARELGAHRPQIYRWLEMYALDSESYRT